MLNLLFISLLLCLMSPLSFPYLLMITLLLFISSSAISVQPLLIDTFLMVDDTSLLMVYMTLFVMYTSFLFSPRSSHSTIALTLMLICCLGVFSSQNILLLYFCYEASLLPILYIILKWGSYPERSLSSVMLLVYTALFTLPFLFVIGYLWSTNLTFNLLNSKSFSPAGALSVLTLLCFSVKLPIYGLHFWLPMAHVEAPTYGSMLLAGVLLKLGGVGLMRLMPLFSFDLTQVTLAYSLLFIPLVSWICCSQSDMKRLIAYSSVSHMMALIPLVSLSTSFSYFTCILIMLFHGLSSPLLFMLVGVVYSHYSTRQLILIRGLILTSPLLSFIAVISFLFSLSAPPFPSFVSEVYFIMNVIHMSKFFLVPLFVFCLLSLIYNINWLSCLLFSNHPPMAPSQLSYSQFMPMLMSCLSPLFLILVLCCV